MYTNKYMWSRHWNYYLPFVYDRVTIVRVDNNLNNCIFTACSKKISYCTRFSKLKVKSSYFGREGRKRQVPLRNHLILWSVPISPCRIRASRVDRCKLNVSNAFVVLWNKWFRNCRTSLIPTCVILFKGIAWE